MTVLLIALAVYLAVGVALGVWGARLHDRESWARLPEMRWRGPLWLLGALQVVAITAVLWPCIAVLAARKVRKARPRPTTTVTPRSEYL